MNRSLRPPSTCGPGGLSDARWELIRPALQARRDARVGIRRPTHDLRDLVDAVLCVDRTGISRAPSPPRLSAPAPASSSHRPSRPRQRPPHRPGLRPRPKDRRPHAPRLQSMGRLRLRGRRHRTRRHPRHRPLRRRFGSSGNAGAPPLVRPGRDSPAVARATPLPVKSRPGPGRPVVRRHQNRRVPGPGAPGRDGCGGRCPPGRRREVWEAREISRMSLVQWCLE
ncbi:transposase [Streptomyces sp. enrichment culture]|uniref:transposase n=1 Tax=Streptomyces sp. enrichment culture TaxID=1795815 RepID=UPI003F57F9FE